MYLKIHQREGKKVVACCSENLIGKTLEEGNYYLEISEFFYKGKVINSEEELIEAMHEAQSINLLGKEPVEIALRKGFIKDADIIKIRDIPHIQIYRL